MAHGYIKKTKTGKYKVTFDFGYKNTVNGEKERIRKSKTFDKWAEANEALTQHSYQMEKGSRIFPKTITLSQWYVFWIENVKSNIEKTTRYGYDNIFKNHIEPQLGHCCLQKPSVDELAIMIQEYYTVLRQKKGLDENTIIKHHDLLNGLFSAAEKYKVIRENPIKLVTPPKKNKREANFYTPEQMGLLWITAQRDPLKIPIYLAGYIGLRREEIVGLKWKNVDFTMRTININEVRTQAGSQVIEKGPKSATSIRMLYMPDGLYDALWREKLKQTIMHNSLPEIYDAPEYVVVKKDGKPYRPNFLSHHFRKFVIDHNLSPITLHQLRHTFGALSNSAGVSMFNLSKAMGHSKLEVTQKYVHSFNNDFKPDINAVASILDRSKEQMGRFETEQLYEVVRGIINEWDPVNFVENFEGEGYKAEIKVIVDRIDPFMEVSDLAHIIFATFKDSFGNRLFQAPFYECAEIAEKILKIN